MICKGTYTWGLFHSWDKWVLEERERKTEFLTGATLTAPVAVNKTVSIEFFQSRRCTRCRKSKVVKLTK